MEGLTILLLAGSIVAACSLTFFVLQRRLRQYLENVVTTQQELRQETPVLETAS